MLELDLPNLALALALGTDNGNDGTSFGVSTSGAGKPTFYSAMNLLLCLIRLHWTH